MSSSSSIIILGDNSFEASKLLLFETTNDLTTLNIVLE